MSSDKVYNEHIFAIAHELRTPLAVITSNTFNQINILKNIYHNIPQTSENVDLIKKLKESIMLVEMQAENIESFISTVADHGLYNAPSNNKMLIHMKTYMDHIMGISPSFSRNMAIFGDDGISYGDCSGYDFQNVHVVVNPQELNQIIINICTNAADAVSSHWKKNKYTSNFFPQLSFRCLKCLQPCQTLVMNNEISGPFGSLNSLCKFFLVIEDNGPGISPEDMKKIFDYGFTTKTEKTEKNLGFGLHICMTLAKKNNLSLFIKTDDRGTRFYIGFPEILVAEPGKLKENVFLNNLDYSNNYAMLNFSDDSKKLYLDSVYRTEWCLNEYRNSDETVPVFVPKNKK